MSSGPFTETPAAAGPDTALAAAWARSRRRFVRSLIFIVALCVAIALLLSAFNGGSLATKLVYSFSIGLSCWILVEGTRLLVSGLSDHMRRLRGWPAAAPAAHAGWRAVIPGIVLAVLLGPPLGLTIADHLTGNRSPSLLHFDDVNTRVTVLLTILGSAASVFTLSMLERLSSARAQAEAAQRLAAENQLRLLQSQLEPHMLFNTLANLRVLIGLDPQCAQAMLDRMIAFLRATLTASRATLHPLSAEFERLADYLSLMGIRMGERLQVKLELPPSLAALAVPPLLLQPLVENAIKHGLEPQVAGGLVRVQAQAEGDMLVLTVHDSGVGIAGSAATADGGFGLRQVHERLATLYGARATLQLAAAAGGGTLATLRLPLERPRP